MAQQQPQLQQQRKILVVDDEAYVSSVLALKFKNAGNLVVTASDGEEGFLAARQELPDLIVTDFQMPILSGLEMARRLKAEAATAHIPLLMLTARGHRMMPSEMGETNIRAVLDKPFSVREVVARAEEIMAGADGAAAVPPVAAAAGSTPAVAARRRGTR
jgi:DNA-binding response OmpR family regulator